jgi:hypothetical protein
MPPQSFNAQKTRRGVALDQRLLGTLQRLETRIERRLIWVSLLGPEQRRLERAVSLDIGMVAALSAKQQDMVAVQKLQLGYFRRQLEIIADLVTRAFPDGRVPGNETLSLPIEERPDLLASNGFHMEIPQATISRNQRPLK